MRQSSVNQVRQHQESTELQYRRSIVPSVWAGPLEFDLIPVTILFFLVGAVLAWLQKDQNHLDLQINIKPGPIRGAVPMLAKIRVNMRGSAANRIQPRLVVDCSLYGSIDQVECTAARF